MAIAYQRKHKMSGLTLLLLYDFNIYEMGYNK